MPAVSAAGNEKLVFLLGGQGTQYFGMARALLENDDVFGSTMRELDELAVKRCGRSVLDYLYDPARTIGDRCDDLLLTFLGLYMVEYSLARSLASRGIRPDAIVGSSLGEFIAVSIAGLVDVGRCIDFLCDVAEHIIVTMPPGGMVAVLADRDEFDDAVKPQADISMAAVNSRKHFVISADAAALARVRRQMDARNILHQDLPVNFAFHSFAVDALERGMRELGDGFRTARPAGRPELWSSRTAGPVTEISADTYWRVIREPIRFIEAVTAIPDHRQHRYVDLSPSSTLAATLRNGLPGITSLPVITQFGDELRNISQVSGLVGAR